VLTGATAKCSGFRQCGGAIQWRLSDELIASISLLLPFFDKQFEYSLSL